MKKKKELPDKILETNVNFVDVVSIPHQNVHLDRTN